MKITAQEKIYRERISKYNELAKENKLFGILCNDNNLPDHLLELVGIPSKVWRIQASLDEGYICPIGEKGYWVLFKQVIILEDWLIITN